MRTMRSLIVKFFVPRWVENAVGGSENPFITDQTGSTQQLLRTTLIQHHLPANYIKHNIKNKAAAAFDMINHGKIFENICLKTAPVLYLPWSTAHFSLILLPLFCFQSMTSVAPSRSYLLCWPSQTRGALHTLTKDSLIILIISWLHKNSNF